jgi:hypothetical protein
MTSREFQAACQLRLGCDIPSIDPALRCFGCTNRPLIGTKGQHYGSCSYGNNRQLRHNCVVQTGVSLLTSANFLVRTTVPPLPRPNHVPGPYAKGLIPDFQLLNDGRFPNDDGRHTIFDVTVVHPCCPTYISKHSDTIQGIAAHTADTKKHVKYDEAAAAHDLRFVPLAFEVFGYWGTSMCNFFDTYVKEVGKKTPHIPFSSIKRYWIMRFSTTLQRNFARMVIDMTTDKFYKNQGISNRDESDAPDVYDSTIRVRERQ